MTFNTPFLANTLYAAMLIVFKLGLKFNTSFSRRCSSNWVHVFTNIHSSITLVQGGYSILLAIFQGFPGASRGHFFAIPGVFKGFSRGTNDQILFGYYQFYGKKYTLFYR